MSDDPTLIGRLLDIEAIKQLKARYFRTVDRRQWDEFGRVFARNAVMEIPEVDATLNGREAIVVFVTDALVDTRTVHHGHMPEIEFTGPDDARGIWAMFDYVESTPTPDGERVALTGYGHYMEEYIREDGEWRIARTRLERLHIGLDPSSDAFPDPVD